MSRRTIHELLDEARRGLARLTAVEASRAQREGAILLDTRSEHDRRRQGLVPGAVHCHLSVLEWRLDQSSGHCDLDVPTDAWIVLICAEGYSSSLAAARLQALGFRRATDVIDGVDGWRAAGLPIDPTPTPT